MRDKKYKLSLSDIWYYYKVHFLVAVVIILTIVYIVHSAVTKVTPDFTLDCFSDTGITYDAADELSAILGNSGTITDNDGDGQVVVNVSSYATGLSTGQGDPSFIEAIQLKMAVGESPIIMAEPKIFEMYDDSDVFMDITHIADECNIPQSDRIILNGNVIGIKVDSCPLFTANGFDAKDLYISLRTPSLSISKDQELMKSFDNAEDVAKYILKGN